MMGRFGLLALALFALVVPTGAAEPTVSEGQGPYGGNLGVDPIIYWSAIYTEPGSTDCYTGGFGHCYVHGPGKGARYLHIVIEGVGRVHYDISDNAAGIDLSNGDCVAPSAAGASCVFQFSPFGLTSTDFELIVPTSSGNAGTAIYVALEDGQNVLGQRI